MKTLRYNTQSQTYTMHDGQYKTYDDNPGRIDPPVVQLEVIETIKPDYDPATQRLLPVTYDIAINEGEHDLYGINGTAIEVWTVEDKTAFEIVMQDWQHPEFSKRIVAPVQLILDDIGIKMYGWFQINAMPVVKANDYQVHLYCNHILEDHQAIIDQLSGVITIEERPQE